MKPPSIRMQQPVSASDRFIFGVLFAVVGVVLGAVMAFVAAIAFDLAPPVRVMLVCSATYFSCVGAVTGDRAGSFAGDALSAVAEMVLGGFVSPPSKGDEQGSSPSWAAFWVLGIWFFGLLLIAWAW